MEAWRRALDGPVSAFPIEKAGPAHIATLKTFDPPLAALEGRRLAGAERRAKRLLFPTEDGELVLLVHLMTAGRLRYLEAGEKGPKTPAFRLLVPGRRRARPHRGRVEEARRRLAADPRGGRGRARAPRPGGERARTRSGSARSSPTSRGACTRSCATSGRSPGSGAPGRTRSSTRRSSPRTRSRRSSTPRRSSGCPTRSTTSSSAASSSASAARTTSGPTASTTSSASPATCAARRSPGSTSRSTRSTTARVPDRRAGAQGPAALAPAALSGELSTPGGCV